MEGVGSVTSHEEVTVNAEALSFEYDHESYERHQRLARLYALTGREDEAAYHRRLGAKAWPLGTADTPQDSNPGQAQG